MASWVIHTTISCPSLSCHKQKYPGSMLVIISWFTSSLSHIIWKPSMITLLHRNWFEQGIYTYPLHGIQADMPMCFQLSNEPGMKPPAHLHQCHGHAEFCLTSCECGTLLSHGFHEAEGAHVVKNSNYSIMKRKHLSARRVQVHNHHTEGLSAVMGNVSYNENGDMKNPSGRDYKSCSCSLSSFFDVIHIWMTTVTAPSAVSKYSSQQALLALPGQQRRWSCCVGDKALMCHLPCRSPLSLSLSPPLPGLSRCGSEDPHYGIPRFQKRQIEPNLACACVKIVKQKQFNIDLIKLGHICVCSHVNLITDWNSLA